MPTSARSTQPARAQRLLVLQNSSFFEAFGGVEYYQDDFLCAAADVWGAQSCTGVLLRRGTLGEIPERPYRIRFVDVPRSRWLRPLTNRFWPTLFRAALEEGKRLGATSVVAPHVSLGPIAHAVGRWFNIPYAIVGHGIEVWGDLWPQDAWSLRHAHRILPVSHWTQAMLVKQGFPQAKMRIVHPALPVVYEKLPAPRRPRPGGGPFTLLTISRLDASERYKGHDHVLQALYRLRLTDPELSFRYIVQGDGTDRGSLEELTQSLGLGGIVEFRGRVADRAQFETTYREADAFVMPSRFGHWDGRWKGEGFGTVYLEAGAFGLPSLAYDCGGATDIIQHGVTGLLLVQDSIADLATALAKLARDRSFAFEMGKKAHERVMAQFTRARMADRIRAAWEGMPGRRDAP